MDILLENVPLLLVCTVSFLIVYAALLNIYFIHKNGFHIGVNCWFCNKNSNVLYSKRNSFECPFCFQYNGFRKDGDYNKVIEAQHNASLNTPDVVPNQNSSPKSFNGLCNSCNRNQELKVLQLANYEPLAEKNYDKEIKHFEEQLEKTYGLCKACSKFVKNTVRKQSLWIFGNRIKNLKTPQFSFLSKSNRARQGSQRASKFYHRLSIFRIILLILSNFNLGVLCGLDVFLPKIVLPKLILPNNVILSNVYTFVTDIYVTNFKLNNFLIYLPKIIIKFHESSTLHICMLGFFVELLYSFVEKNRIPFSKFNKLICWLILGLVSSVHVKQDISLYFRTLEIFCSLYLTYVYISTCLEPQDKQYKKYRLKRIKRDYTNVDNSEKDVSDSDSLSNFNESYMTAANKHSPITASSFSNLNRSFESDKSMKSRHTNLHTAKNTKLNEHFNDLNIGAYNSNISNKVYQSPASPNPFLNQNNSRPQSPTSLYNYGSTYNIMGSPFLNQSQHRSLVAPQSPRLNSSFNMAANSPFTANPTSQLLNNTRSISPMSVRTEPMCNYNQTNNLAGSVYNQGLNQPSTSFLSKSNYQHSSVFSPRDTSSVFSENLATPSSPAYNLRSSIRSNVTSPIPSGQLSSLNNSFRPLSPANTLERPTRSLLSPSKLSNTNSFHSDARAHGNLSMSFHTDTVPNSGLWSNMHGSHLHQRFVVNSLSNINCNSPFTGGLIHENVDNKLNNSRSSSSSSGFISNGGFTKRLSRSLPNSRENSPERTSLLSEPIFN